MKMWSKLALLVSVVLVTRAFSEYTQFAWYDQYNVLKDKDGNPINIGNGTVLTFLSDDTTVNANSSISNGTLNLKNSYEDDQFYLARGTVDFDGYYLTQYMTETDGTYIGKYVYAIILDYPYNDFTALGSTDAERLANVPRDGSVYAGITAMGDDAGTIKPLQNAEPPYGIPQSYHGGTVQTSYQVIPEPSSLLLVFGAAGVIGLYQRLRRR